MDDEHDRRIFIWRNSVDPTAETNRLADAIAEKAMTELFELQGSLVWLRNGKVDRVSKTLMTEIVSKHIVSVRLAGSAEDGWRVEYYSFPFPAGTRHGPDERVLFNLMEVLIPKVGRGPREVPAISAQIEREIRARLKTGEPEAAIAKAYNIDTIAIRQLVAP